MIHLLDKYLGSFLSREIEMIGILDYASARRRKDAIGLTEENGKEFTLIVQEGTGRRDVVEN